ncbi:CinA family protein [Microbacterium album]|nr:nicotinamide-nucleotide amidohydrolase family protein [Microbacterium album]
MSDIGPARVLELLRRRGWTIAVAESLTGGLVVSSLVTVPGASASLRGGVVAYDSAVKRTLLGVDAGLLAAQGAVHPEVARQMAAGVRAAMTVDGCPADVGVSTTGIAGPDSPDGQPVGTVHVAVLTPETATTSSFVLPGDRDAIRRGAATHALQAVADALSVPGAHPVTGV